MKRPPIATLVGLFVALGLPFVLTLLFDEGPGGLSDPSFVAREWLITLILLGIVFFWERQSLASD